MKREAIYGILNYENQLLPPFMEDMEEYQRCLDVIADCNHIVTMDLEEEVEDHVVEPEFENVEDPPDNNPEEEK